MNKTEYIKEKKELTPRDSLCRAESWMQEMYGLNLEKFDNSEQTNHIVSIAEKDGIKGVRFCIGGVDIFIEAHNLDNGEEFEWKKAMGRLEEVGKRTFYKHEMYMIAACIEGINAALREIGGDELEGYYWSSTEYNSSNAWFVYFSDGYIYRTGKRNSCTVRPCAAF